MSLPSKSYVKSRSISNNTVREKTKFSDDSCLIDLGNHKRPGSIDRMTTAAGIIIPININTNLTSLYQHWEYPMSCRNP